MIHFDAERSSDHMRDSFIPAVEISNCPFCGKGFLKPAIAVSPIVFHPGIVTDDDCVLSGMGFREHQFPLLNRRSS